MRVWCEIGGLYVDLAFAAKVEVVRDCLATRRPPTYHRRTWLERHDKALLVYLDEVSSAGAWRTLLARVRETPPFGGIRQVWLGRIAQSGLDLAEIGRALVDCNAQAEHQATLTAIPVEPSGDSDRDGPATRAGPDGTTATLTPTPRSAAVASRLRIPLSDVERRELRLQDDTGTEDETPDVTGIDVPMDRRAEWTRSQKGAEAMNVVDIFAEPANTNLAWQWVSAILPGDATSPWGKTLQVFTTVHFAAGSFGLAYGVITGIVNSAYTGKVLGQKWHQIWTPLRIVLGSGVAMPHARH